MPQTDDPELGPELGIGPDGKTDAALQEAILDNPAANSAFQDEAILRAVRAGMSLDDATAIYGGA